MEKANEIKQFIDVFDIRPLEAENLDAFYVDTSEARGDDTALRLVFQLEESRRRYKKFLFGGHTGCGKSTELSKIEKMLEDKYFVIRYSIGVYVDYRSVSYVDVIFSALKYIIEYSRKNNLQLDENSAKVLMNYWNKETTVTNSNEQNTDWSNVNKVDRKKVRTK